MPELVSDPTPPCTNTPATWPEIVPPAVFTRPPPASSAIPCEPAMEPLFVTTPVVPVTKTPKSWPETEPPDALLKLPPPLNSTPAPVVVAAVMLPALLTVPPAAT